MKWFVVAGFLLFVIRSREGAVLKCTPGAQDTSCTIEKEEKELSPTQLVKGESEDVKPTPTDAECSPGSEWNSNCHYCRCSDTGVAECLKQNTCDMEIIAEPIRCKPNTNFQRDCNTCICLENGLGLCTLESCQRSVPKKSDLVFGKECAPGSHWKSQCNQCGCTADGHAFCTEISCLGQENEPLLSCAPDTMWRNECNTCWCTREGRALCTKIGCVSPIISTDINNKPVASETKQVAKAKTTVSRKVRATPQEPPKTCQPGQEFRMDCNKCLCDNEGQDFSCTRIDCNALNNNNNGGTRRKRDVSKDQEVPNECTPGSVFERGCNVCRCTADGRHGTCALKRCPTDNDVKPVESDPSFRCNPGEQFKQDCNDCTCSADGRSVFCTLRLCDGDLVPSI